MDCEIPLLRMRTKSLSARAARVYMELLAPSALILNTAVVRGMSEWREEGRIRRDCEEAFTVADEGQKGYLTAEDYKVAVLSLFGYKPSKYEVASVWKTHCSDEGEAVGAAPGLQREKFVSLAAQRLRQQDVDEVARQVFLAFDVHCQGFVTEQDCMVALQKVAPGLARERVPAYFREVDVNGDGRVSYQDFVLMLRHSTC